MAPRYSLSISDIILRGCEREPPNRLLGSMQAHYLHPQTPDEWGLSVAATPGCTEDEILKAARHLRQSHYRVASVERIRDLSGDLLAVPYEEMSKVLHLNVTWDHNAHGLILCSREPTLDLAASIAAAFGVPKMNPYYEERSRARARR